MCSHPRVAFAFFQLGQSFVFGQTHLLIQNDAIEPLMKHGLNSDTRPGGFGIRSLACTRSGELYSQTTNQAQRLYLSVFAPCSIRGLGIGINPKKTSLRHGYLGGGVPTRVQRSAPSLPQIKKARRSGRADGQAKRGMFQKLLYAAFFTSNGALRTGRLRSLLRVPPACSYCVESVP